MRETLRVALAQTNPTVGDLSGNASLVAVYSQQARDLGADLVAFPELTITGYPPEDLLLKASFLADNLSCLRDLRPYSRDVTIVVGFVDVAEDIFNAAAILHGGEVRGVYRKSYLPTYSVFDEDRYFSRGDSAPVYELDGVGIGVNICEDIWYPTGPMAAQALSGAELVVNLSASPYRLGNPAVRERMLATRAQDHGVFLAFVNTVGGQDELLFDGYSACFDTSGEVICRAPAFTHALLVADLDVGAVLRQRLRDPRRRKAASEDTGFATRSVHRLGSGLNSREKPPVEPVREPRMEPVAEVYEGLKLALRDYTRKTGFEKVVLGMSGGIDSSLVATIAADALGAANVVGVSMPSQYSSEASRMDADALARNLGIELMTVPIERPYCALLDALSAQFEGTGFGVTEENLQSRIRGVILMALSNKFGWLVVTTGNKSESAVGYSTLYGDTAGGFALLKDVPKTLVYELARYRNRRGGVIPASVITKPPSAELRPGQKDADSLPPYDVLDPILEHYIEGERSADEIIKLGFDPGTVGSVIRMVDRAEHKRRQSPPGPKVTPRAFGRDRRLPIVNRYGG